MKTTVYLRMVLPNIEVGDHLDPKLDNPRWRTTWGTFQATAGPAAKPPSKYAVAETPAWIRAVKDEVADLLAQHGADMLSASVQIVPQDVPKS